MRKAPSGKRHIPCIDHVQHDYMSSGWVCITTNEPGRAADMLAFADELTAIRAAHRAAEELRWTIPASGRDETQVTTDVRTGDKHYRPRVAYAGTATHLPFVSRCAHANPCDGRASVEPIATIESIRAEKRAILAEPVEPTAALETCNSCDIEPASPDSVAGYCDACERAAREPVAETVAPIDWTTTPHTARADLDTIVYAPNGTADDPMVARCVTCTNPIAYLASADECYDGRSTHDVDVVAAAMRALGMLGDDAPAVVLEPVETVAPEPARLHLTYTGPHAGDTYCAEGRNSRDTYQHAGYGDAYRAQLARPDLCDRCRESAETVAPEPAADLARESAESYRAESYRVETADYAPVLEPVAEVELDHTGHDYRPADGRGVRPCPGCATMTDDHGWIAPAAVVLEPVVLEPVAEPVVLEPEPAVIQPCDDCGATGYHRCAGAVEAIAEAQRIIAALPEPAAIVAPVVASAPVARPTCHRCGQLFRKSGSGLAWHLANRPDCAGTGNIAPMSAPETYAAPMAH